MDIESIVGQPLAQLLSENNMAHFAKLDLNNVVVEVNALHNNELLDNGVENEAKGIAFLTDWSGGYSNWKQTSYNSTFRKNYAAIGYTYYKHLDAFVPPKYYSSWLLDGQSCQWIAPVAYPTDGKMYRWDESTIAWVES